GESFFSPPPTAAAPHLARAAAIEIIKDRSDAAAVPVACDEPDPFPRDPAETGRRPCREPRAVDDEIAAVRGLHDLDHVLLGRQRVPVLIVVLIVPRTSGFRLLRKGRRAYQHGQRERRHPFEHDLGLPADGGGRIEAIFSAAKGTSARPDRRCKRKAGACALMVPILWNVPTSSASVTSHARHLDNSRSSRCDHSDLGGPQRQTVYLSPCIYVRRLPAL